MKERTRYRVTGSVFLVALAVIFLPMLFDGVGAPLREIPAQPKQTYATQMPDFADVVPTSDVVARVEDLRREVDAEGFATDSGTRFGDPVLRPFDSSTSIWAVQAASFADLDNARSFREDLRQAGYEAFISTAKDQPKGVSIMHRVAVGPLLSKDDAVAIQTAVGSKFELEPTIVEMTP